MSKVPLSCDKSNSLVPSPASPLSEREPHKAHRRATWKKTQDKLTPENATEFVLYSLLTTLAILGFCDLLTLVFDQAHFGLVQVGMALMGGFYVTLSSLYWQKLQNDSEA